jgi:LPXTG-motif cell wall-anchored protein
MKKTLFRAGTVAAGTVFGLTALVGPALAASESFGTAYPAGWGHGYNGVINNHAAAAWLMKVEGGSTVEVFCVDEPATYDDSPTTKYTATTWAESGRQNLAKASDIAANAGKRGTPLTDKNAEYAARQLAIWKFTNGTDYSKVNNAAIRNRATALVQTAQDGTEKASSAVVRMETAQTGSKDTITVHVTTADGKPMADQAVQVTGDGVSGKIETDANGAASLTVDAPEEDTDVIATWNGVLPAGTVLVPATAGAQKVMTSADAPITRSATATIAGAPAAPTTPPTVTPTTEPTKAPTKAPTTEPTKAPGDETPSESPAAPKPAEEPSDAPSELPYTGTTLTWAGAVAAAAVAAGGFWLRRRYSHR